MVPRGHCYDKYAQRFLGFLYLAADWSWAEILSQHASVLRQISIVGYRCLRRTRASAVRNCQWMPVEAAWRAYAHAVTCARTGPAASERVIPVRPCGANGRVEA